MRVFTTATIDNETGYEIFVDEASYNNACSWLTSVGYINPNCSVNKDGTVSIMVEKIYDHNNMRKMKALFLYNETKGRLMLVKVTF